MHDGQVVMFHSQSSKVLLLPIKELAPTESRRGAEGVKERNLPVRLVRRRVEPREGHGREDAAERVVCPINWDQMPRDEVRPVVDQSTLFGRAREEIEVAHGEGQWCYSVGPP